MKKQITYSQHKIAYTINGSGKQTLMLLHGFCETSEIWKRQVPALAELYTVICPDLPGFGESDVAIETSVEEMAASVKAILDEEVKHRVTLIGHSMGGYVSLAFAEHHGDRLNGFGFLHSTAFADSEEKKENRLKSHRFIADHGTGPFVKNLVPGLFAPEYSKKEDIAEALKIAEECDSKGLMSATLAMRNRPDRTNVLQGAKVPVLFCVGEKDSIVPPEKLYEQASYPSRSSVVGFRQSGHMGMMEETEHTNNTFNNFVKLCNNI